MAEEKSGFLLYADQRSIFDKLPDDIAGKLIKHIYSYINDENPEAANLLMEIAFEPIKLQLKRDLKKWDKKRVERSESGKKGADARWQKMANDGLAISEMANDGKRISPMAKMAVTVTDTVNVTAINKQKVVEFLRGAAPISIPQAQIEQQADLLMKQYQGKKIGNLKALCNKWMHNFQETPTMPTIEPNYWEKMRNAL